MFKRTIAALTVLVAMLCFAVKVDAADARTKDDTWLIYLYICGPDNLEGDDYLSTKDIAEIQHIKLPPNVKVLIGAGSTKKWHHPAIKTGGHGIYLYSNNNLEKCVNWNTDINRPDTNMGDPSTLESFLKYGEENFPSDHKIIIFWNHGGISGVCYDDNFKGDGLYYDELKSAFTSVYGDSPEKIPFELIGFKACLTGSYELANSISNFSHYMLGSEPSVYDWNFSDWIAALAKDPSMNGAQIGRIICDNALKSYDAETKLTHTFSLIDLTKMPELRQAYEEYFDEALKRSEEETGFSAAFARAAENRNVDKYSNLYVDLGLLAKNTKSIMPETSGKLLSAIDKAVVYNRRGAYLKSKGISTYYPYISSEKVFSEVGAEQSTMERDLNFDVISKQNSSYSAQKDLYSKLLNLDVSDLQGEVPIERKDGHLVANLTPEQMGVVSSVYCILFPLSTSGAYDFGGAVLISADDLKADWKKGIFTENFRAVEPVFDGQRIIMFPTVSGRGHTFYSVPILVEVSFEDEKTGTLGYVNVQRDLIVRYDNSTKKYEIVGFANDIENGAVRGKKGKPRSGITITPLYVTISSDGTNELLGYTEYADKDGNQIPLMSVVYGITDPKTNEKLFIKWKAGTPFVYTERNSTITDRKITRGVYFYQFSFNAPNGNGVSSQLGAIAVNNGKITRLTTEELFELLANNAK